MSDEIKEAYAALRTLLQSAPLGASEARVQALHRLDESEMWVKKAAERPTSLFEFAMTGGRLDGAGGSHSTEAG